MKRFPFPFPFPFAFAFAFAFPFTFTLALAFMGCDGRVENHGARFFLVRDPDGTLERGFGVAISEQRETGGEWMGKTAQGRWVSMRRLDEAVPVRALARDAVNGRLDVGWVIDRDAYVWASPDESSPPIAKRATFDVVRVLEDPEREKGWLRTADGYLKASQARWVRPAERPTEVGPAELWVDVDRTQQVMSVYDGDRLLWATLVSTGSLGQGTRLQTPKGRFRIWLKSPAATMDSDNRKDVAPYRYEEVPWVQYFLGEVALHAAYWHQRFGHPLTHGCVNMPPADAHRLYEMTQSLSKTAPGTLVRVR